MARIRPVKAKTDQPNVGAVTPEVGKGTVTKARTPAVRKRVLKPVVKF